MTFVQALAFTLAAISAACIALWILGKMLNAARAAFKALAGFTRG